MKHVQETLARLLIERSKNIPLDTLLKKIFPVSHQYSLFFCDSGDGYIQHAFPYCDSQNEPIGWAFYVLSADKTHVYMSSMCGDITEEAVTAGINHAISGLAAGMQELTHA